MRTFYTNWHLKKRTRCCKAAGSDHRPRNGDRKTSLTVTPQKSRGQCWQPGSVAKWLKVTPLQGGAVLDCFRGSNPLRPSTQLALGLLLEIKMALRGWLRTFNVKTSVTGLDYWGCRKDACFSPLFTKQKSKLHHYLYLSQKKKRRWKSLSVVWTMWGWGISRLICMEPIFHPGR